MSSTSWVCWAPAELALLGPEVELDLLWAVLSWCAGWCEEEDLLSLLELIGEEGDKAEVRMESMVQIKVKIQWKQKQKEQQSKVCWNCTVGEKGKCG